MTNTSDPAMQLYAIRIFVRDWPLACDFYEHKLGLKAEFKSVEFSWAEYATGGSKLCIEGIGDEAASDCDSNEAVELVGRFTGVVLRVADVASSYQALSEQGVTFTAPPERQEWGGILAHFTDPDGNILTLMSE